MGRCIYEWVAVILLVASVFSSCNNVRKENKDELIAEMMDSLMSYKEEQDGKRMIIMLIHWNH